MAPRSLAEDLNEDQIHTPYISMRVRQILLKSIYLWRLKLSLDTNRELEAETHWPKRIGLSPWAGDIRAMLFALSPPK